MSNGDYRPGLSGGQRFGSGTKSDPWLPIEVADKDAFYGSALRDYRDAENQSAMLRFEHEFSNNFKLQSTLAWIGSEQEYVMSRPSVVPQFITGRDGSVSPNPNWDPTRSLANRGLRSGKKDNSAVAFHTALPSQWRVDLMAAYKINETAELQVNVNNAFDERLYDASHVGIFANRAPGRSVTAKLNYRF
ncbi:TonB-dependent receptor [Paracoccus sp. SSJ]|nr:TonB-dependent receptor [Paracoccus sp. SSJ]